MIVLKNLAESFITAAINDTDTQITVPADHADIFPRIALENDHYYCALQNPATSAIEFVKVTARVGNVLTVSRGEEGTTALSFPVESRIDVRMTVSTWEEMSGECWMRPKNADGEVVLPDFVSSSSFTLAGDFTAFFTKNRAVKAYPNKSVGFVESATFADNITTVKVIEMTVQADLTHVEAGLDPDSLAKRTLSNEELLGYMTPVPVLEVAALEVDGGTLVSGTIKHPEVGKSYSDSTEFHFNLPDGVTDFVRTGLSFQIRMPVITELESPKALGPITCRAAQLSLILSDPSNEINMTVRYVGIKVGVTLAYADTPEGWSNGDVTADGAKLPATTTGLNNPSGKAIVSGTPEVEITGVEIPLLEGSTAETIKTSDTGIKVGDDVVCEVNGTSESTTVQSATEESTPQTVFSSSSFWTGATDGFVFTGDDIGNAANEGGATIRSAKKIVGNFEFKFKPTSGGGGNETFIGFFPESKLDLFGEGEEGLLAVETLFYIFDQSAGTGTRTMQATSMKDGSYSSTKKIFTSETSQEISLKRVGSTITATLAGTPIYTYENGTSEDGYLFVNAYGGATDNYQCINDVTVDFNDVYFNTAVSPALSSVPEKVFKKQAIQLALGAGRLGEFLGSEVPLKLDVANSTTSVLKILGAFASKIFILGGKQNKLKVGGDEVEVSGVAEEQVEDPTTVEILSNQGSFIHSTLDPVSVAKYPDMNPFNSDVGETYQKGFCGQNGRAALKDFIGADFTVPTSIAGIYFQQYQAAANDVSKVMIRKSDDGTTWVDVKEFDVSTNNANQLLRLDSAVSAKYWALLATTNTGNGGDEYPWLIQYARWVAPAASFITTATLASPLAQAPTAETAVSIPESCTHASPITACVISGNALKYTGTKVPFADPAIKRLAMKVSGDTSLRAKAAKIYTEEGA